jgi:type II secretory pathway pseudopilin PulG
MVELLVIIGILAVVLAILLPVLGRARNAGQSVTCLSNLRQISIGLELFAEQNNNCLPDPSQTQVSWEQSISPFVQARTAFLCPSDAELFPNVGSSYDWRDTGNVDTTLAGRDLNSIRRPDAVLAFDALPAWHCNGRLNVVRLDGSTLSMDQNEWFNNMDIAVSKP